MGDDFLRLYLEDHLAGSTGGLELCKRAQHNNRDSELGGYLKLLGDELRNHRMVLVGLLRRLGGKPPKVKRATAWLVEKGGRLKLNRRLFSYSPLSRVYELEGLLIGTEGRLALFRALAMMQPRQGNLRGVDFDKLLSEAMSSRRRLEAFRMKAASEAFLEGAGGLSSIDRAQHAH